MLAAQSFLLFLGCAAFPLYFLPPGSVQLAHLLLASAAFLALLSREIEFSTPAILLLALASLAFVRESFAVLSGAPLSSVVQAAFVLFNLAILVAVQTYCAQTRAVECFKWGAAAAAAVALGPLLVSGIDLTGERIEQRAIGTFQNPNQLAYFATILFSLTALLFLFGQLSGRMTATIVGASFLLVFAALSKAALVSMFFGLMLLCAGSVSARWLALAGVAGMLLLYQLGVLDPERLLFIQRFQDIGADDDDGLAERGYLILIQNAKHPLEVWFGLGARGVRDANDGHEIHSTYIAFLGLYGMAGGLLYLAFLWSWVRVLVRTLPLTQAAAVVAPPLLYGIAHNGTRFSIFYVLVALTFCLCGQRHPRRPPARRAGEARPLRRRASPYRS